MHSTSIDPTTLRSLARHSIQLSCAAAKVLLIFHILTLKKLPLYMTLSTIAAWGRSLVYSYNKHCKGPRHDFVIYSN